MLSKKHIYPLQSGQAVILPVAFILLIALTLSGRATQPVKSDARLARETGESKRASALADAGAEDISYRVKRAKQYDSTEFVPIDNLFATTTVVTSANGSLKTVTGLGVDGNNVRKKTINLAKGDQVDFNYAVQAGNGGFTMANTSSVRGNLYANGPVTGSNSTKIYGSVGSAGSSGLIDGAYSTSTAWAHTIQNATVDNDAYYQSISNTTVSGSSCPNPHCYPDSPDKPTAPFPLSDAKIAEWEQEAETGGVYSGVCPYKITESVTIGPMKIPCDLEISNNPTVTFAGMVWVVGSINFKNSNSIRLDPALGSKSIAIIADNPANRSSGSTVSIANSTAFVGSGTKGSFFFLISANTSSENGGGATAINLTNTATGPVVLYSNHGKVSIGNSSQLKSVTGHLISLSNSAELIYDDGLESALFDTGPGGSWNILNWKETQ